MPASIGGEEARQGSTKAGNHGGRARQRRRPWVWFDEQRTGHKALESELGFGEVVTAVKVISGKLELQVDSWQSERLNVDLGTLEMQLLLLLMIVFAGMWKYTVWVWL
jgi:hypothetical protein